MTWHGVDGRVPQQAAGPGLLGAGTEVGSATDHSTVPGPADLPGFPATVVKGVQICCPRLCQAYSVVSNDEDPARLGSSACSPLISQQWWPGRVCSVVLGLILAAVAVGGTLMAAQVNENGTHTLPASHIIVENAMHKVRPTGSIENGSGENLSSLQV